MRTGMIAVAATMLAILLPPLSHADGLSPQDYMEIEQLYAQYNQTLDANDAEGWVNTFTADGSFMTYTGRDALIGFVKRWHERMGGSTRRHWNSNLRLSGDATKAEASVYLMLVDVSTRTISGTGTYKDNLVKTPQGWRFAKRVVALDTASPPAAPAQQQPK